MQCMETNIETEPGDIDRPMWSCRRPHVVEFKLEKVPNYIRKWLASEKNKKSQAERSEAELQEPFRMQQSNKDLLKMQQSNLYML